MFVAKAKLADGDTVRMTAAGDNFMSALAALAQTLQKGDKVTQQEAAGIKRLVITAEEGGSGLQRRKFRPREKKETAPASTAGRGPVTPLKGEKGVK